MPAAWTPRRLSRVLVAAGLAAVALLAVHGSFQREFQWTPDGLYYQAQLLEFRGASHAEAFRTAFEGPIAAELRRIDPEHTGNPAWVAYNERFFERRIAVPLAGAAIEPVAGERALLYVGVAGYVGAVLGIFALLLLRFSLPVATGAALITALLPALTDNAPLPHTDTAGLGVLVLALLAGVLAFQRGLRWLPAWVAAIAVLSFTRDSTWVPILAAAWCALAWRSRTGVWLAVSGIAAALPAALLFPVPLRELMAFAMSDFTPTPDATWGYILGRYPGRLVEWMQSNGGFVRDGEWYTGLYFPAGLLLLFALAGREAAGRAAGFMRAAAVAAVPYLLVVPLFSAYRLELVWVPMAAFGLAAGLERVAALTPQRARARLAGQPVVGGFPARQPSGSP
jgi:hypothetical protein